ncbi:MAG TPA: hypothetical protein VGL28_00765 [Steroidobacteraceae bacterium]
MELGDLRVLHWRGARAAGAVGERAGLDRFIIDTCQRRVAIFDAGSADADERSRQQFPDDGPLESHRAEAAYAFLLGFASGLESKLVAETEIFGQIKAAWRDFSEHGSPLARALSPWMQWLFQDAKTVRAQHLSHLGSASYGSQTRRLLGDQAGGGPTLLIGAGQLAQSVAPWLPGSELWLWNRTAVRALELSRELVKREPARPLRLIEGGPQAELAAWRAARNVVVCVPIDPLQDGARIAAWGERSDRAGRVIHLGLERADSAPWHGVPELLSLGVLFDMLRAQSEQRRRQFERARRACREKATLRALGASASHPHSWEDLAAFDSL